jgi:glycosyltransferase involved in cell wall biosynthesis
VKNEVAVLERSLFSAEKAADEIVVVDTGSTDDTVNIARAHGARVFSYAWKEHFSDARNFALEKVTGDWVVFLDADEYFTDDTKENIRTVIENADITECSFWRCSGKTMIRTQEPISWMFILRVFSKIFRLFAMWDVFMSS